VAKLLLGSKKVRGVQKWYGPLYHHAEYGGDRGSRAGCRQKSVGSTENAGPENAGSKIDERTENAVLKMKDQMSGVENAGPENAGPNVMGGKCRT